MASNVAFLVAGTQREGVEEARKRGWRALAYARFIGPHRLDVRVVHLVSEFGRPPKGTKVFIGPGAKEREDWKEFEDAIEHFEMEAVE